MPAPAFRSNIAHWQAMQENGYFENHALYGAAFDETDFDCRMIERFRSLRGVGNVVVVGCGYGRESVHIARRVGHVYGIDVSDTILRKAVDHTRGHGVRNFTPVLAQDFASAIPQGVDLVFSHVVFQHLTRDLAKRYLMVLADKLAPGGAMIIQFCEDFAVPPDADAALEVYEPSVSYDLRRIVEAAHPRLIMAEAWSVVATPTSLWHWVHLVTDPTFYAQDNPMADFNGRGADLDLTESYHFYAAPLPAEKPKAAFSSGSNPWGYAASIGLTDGLTAPSEDLVVLIETRDEPVHLLVVDKDYAQLGERIAIPVAHQPQAVTLHVPKGAAALVVQAGEAPKESPVVLHRVSQGPSAS